MGTHPPPDRKRLAAAQASAADLANARLSAQANVAINYFSMRISEQRILLFQASVAAFTRSAEIVQNQSDAGIVSRVDLAQAQTQLEQTRAQPVAENITRATFEHAVAVLVGKAPAAFTIEPAPLTERCRPSTPAFRRRCSSGDPTSPPPNA